MRSATLTPSPLLGTWLRSWSRRSEDAAVAAAIEYSPRRPQHGQTADMSNREPRWPVEGHEPDPRWTLANERTLMAYERTALGLLVAGLAASGSRELADAPLWLAVLGIPFVVLAAAVALEGRRRFLTTQDAMRKGEPLEAPRVAVFLPWGIACVATIGVLAALAQLALST